jgi:DNA repair exonuclease SbcCD ATPase subunit
VIPVRILLQGFLCYRERTEIGFDDASLWMLSGLNGSGKSAVFDAVTYALFSGHRGGQRNAEELINKESDGLLVEFDFLRGGEVYRIKRTLKKQGRSTRQVLRRQPVDGNGKDTWHAVEGTGSQKGFDEWVRDRIGLGYETFTSSVLLMQGRAEKLLNSDSGERRKVLAGIVDLERYEKLHKRADEQRKKYKDQAEVLQTRLEVLPEVGEAELALADERVAAAEAALGQARAEVERRQRFRVQGEHWAALQAKLAETRRQWERAQGLLAEADAIRRAWDRLRQLRAALPHLRTAVEQRGRLAESEAAAADLAARRQELAEQLTALDYAAAQSRQKRETLESGIAADQRREQEIGRRLLELSGVLARVAMCEQQRQAVAALDAELAELPADPAAALALQQEAHERLAALAQALPFLTRLHEERTGLVQARERLRLAGDEEKAVTAEGTQLAIELRNVTQQAEAAAQARRQADDGAAEARALASEAARQLQEVVNLEGAKVCRHCGQALTPDHLEAERARRTRDRQAAEAAYQQADAARKTAAAEEKRFLKQQKETDERIGAARERHRDCRARQKQAEADVQRHGRECGRAYAELPEAFRLRIGAAPADDWVATTYPAPADLDEMGQEVRGLDAAHRWLQTARGVFDRWTRLQAQRETARRTLAAQEAGLPPDVADLKAEHASLGTEDGALKERLQAQRLRLRAEEGELERLRKQETETRAQAAELDRRLEAEKVRQEGCRETLARGRAALPPDWQPQAQTAMADDLRAWEAEQAALEGQGTEARAEELQQAGERLEALRRDMAERERELEEVPAEARCELAELDRRLADARGEQAAREAELGEARNARKALGDRQEQRRQLQQEFLDLDRQHNRWKLLAELLGPKRLQLHLVRRAERGIVDYANEVLDRLTGGQLYLRLRGEDGEEATERALELEAYNRTAGEAPIGVAFLSGSQRFRVAVSLALGIGQYASRQHRPIESVIIDEGFGCLDRQGRQVMIQELQNLRGHMRCILLVSHQEEFADAFANGYRFELTNGTTAVTRFQR